MNNPSTIARGNVQGNYMLAVTLSPVSVANATTAEQTFSVKGLIVGDMVSVAKAATQGGLGIAGSRVSAADVLAITFINATASAITPTASEVYSVHVVRVENPSSSGVSPLGAVPA